MSFVFTFTSPSRWLSRLKIHTLGAFKEALANCKTLEEFATAIQGYISSEINEAIYMQDLPHLRTQRVNWYEATLEALEAAAMPSDVAAEMTAQSVNQDVESAGESDKSGELARGDRPFRSIPGNSQPIPTPLISSRETR
jgi:hypothetical protein